MPINPDGTPWSPDTTYMAIQEIRDGAQRDLRARDERRSQGRLNAENRYSPYVEVKKDGGQGSVFVVDETLADIRHTGEDLDVLTAGRWAAFRSEPRDEKPFADRFRKQTLEVDIAKAQGRAAEIEATLNPDTQAVPPLLRNDNLHAKAMKEPPKLKDRQVVKV